MSRDERLERAERNLKIEQLYRQGLKQKEIAKVVQISRGRVAQVLRDRGLSVKDSPNSPPGDRYGFIGVNVTKDIRSKFKALCEFRGISMSSYLADFIEKEVKTVSLAETR